MKSRVFMLPGFFQIAYMPKAQQRHKMAAKNLRLHKVKERQNRRCSELIPYNPPNVISNVNNSKD
jgi:hypothetical protein